MPRTSSLDELDRALLVELNVDARRSHRDLAHRLKVSPTTVSARIARLEAAGIVRGYVPLLDEELLGWDLGAVIRVWISKGRLREVEERLAKDPHAYAIFDVTGDSDALVLGRFRDRRDLDRFVKHLLQDPFVERSNTQVVLNRVKEDRRVPLPAPPTGAAARGPAPTAATGPPSAGAAGGGRK